MTSGAQAYDRVYDTAGRLVRHRLGGSLRDITYDAADRISSYKHYDATTGAAQPELDQSFTYDELGRLTHTTLYSGYWDYSYDANGNRTSATVNGTTNAYTISPTSNRITSISNPTRKFTYDNPGNTTADGYYTAVYDLSGRLSTLTKAGVTSTFHMDALGRRVRKFDSSGAASTVIFVHGLDGELLGEYDQTGKAIKEYVWLGSTPVAVFTPDPANTANPPLVYFIHADHIDTPRIIVDKNNQLRWRWLAEPFGTTAPEDNPSGLGQFVFNLRFPGQYFDQATGLTYNWNRYLDNSLGRYTQSDLIGLLGGINTYLYVNGNPLVLVDPEGLSALGTVGGVLGGWGGRVVGGGIGGAIGAAGGTAVAPGPGTAVGGWLGGATGGLAGGKIGSAAGTAAGDWLDELVFAANNKQIRKRIDGIQEQIDKHRKKLDKEPDCDASNHWREEIKIWEDEIARLRRRLPNGK